MKLRSIFATIIMIICIFILSVSAENPNTINYQGRITDPGGNPVPDGNYLVKFIIYNAPVGGVNLWDAGFQNVSCVNGVFSIQLGASPMPTLPIGIFDDSTRYLGITVGADPELTPRTRLNSSPYAYSPWKNSASIIEPRDETDRLRIGTGSFHGVDEKLAIKSNTDTWIGMSIGSTNSFAQPYYGYVTNNLLNCYSYYTGEEKSLGFYNNGGTGVLLDSLRNVGIGTIDPRTRLDVLTSDTVGIRARNTDNEFFSKAIKGEMTAVGSFDAIGVYGKSVQDSVNRYGYGGYFEGGYRGVYTKGNWYGLYASGVDATPTATTIYGVRTVASGGDNSTATHYGIYASATGAATNWAGYFLGNTHVNGTLSKSAGSFKIDHPLDPENKYLQHSFVESPDMMNIYNGNVTTDASGYAVVIMPDYFKALNKEFRYQLTVIGDFAQAIIAEKLQGNRFTIRTDKPNIEVSWQVTGVRQDAFANANRIQVEVEKHYDEKGLYMHPDAFGKSEKQGIDYKHTPEAEAEKRSQSMNQ